MDQQVNTVIRTLHSRITDGEETVELHSADIAALSASMQSMAKRLSMLEEVIAYHCGIKVKDLREVATSIKDGVIDEDSHEIGVVPGD